jgi:hypothetical protein
MPGQDWRKALGIKLITLLDVQKQAFGAYMCRDFHTSCKGSVKLPYGLKEMNVFGQLLFSAGEVEIVIACDDFILF